MLGFASDSLSTWNDLTDYAQPFLSLSECLLDVYGQCRRIVGGGAMEQRLMR